jgi:hypothetical protein
VTANESTYPPCRDGSPALSCQTSSDNHILTNLIITKVATRAMLREIRLTTLCKWPRKGVLNVLSDWHVPDSNACLVRLIKLRRFDCILKSVPLTSLWTCDAQTDSCQTYAFEKSSLFSGQRIALMCPFYWVSCKCLQLPRPIVWESNLCEIFQLAS